MFWGSEDKAMLTIELDPELDARLTAIAKQNGQTKAFYAHAAIAEFIDDLEDHALVEEAMRDYDPSQNISHEQLKRELGLGN